MFSITIAIFISHELTKYSIVYEIQIVSDVMDVYDVSSAYSFFLTFGG